MTEEQWYSSANPTGMLAFLRDKGPSQRKLRLFAAECCRQNWDLLTDPRLRRAVEVAEQFADGRADDRRRAEAEALDAYEGELDRDDEFRVWSEPVLILVAGSPFPWEAAADCARHIIWDAGYVGLDHSFEGVGEELGVEQADFLRDIFGNTVRQVAFDPSWRTSTAVALAKWMYEARDFTAAPILADALEDGGCNDENTLNHLRGPGAHVRGCWPVDLVLGRG